MNDFVVGFLNAYFNMIQSIPEQWIDLVTILTFFVASMAISIFICSIGYFGFYIVRKIIHN